MEFGTWVLCLGGEAREILNGEVRERQRREERQEKGGDRSKGSIRKQWIYWLTFKTGSEKGPDFSIFAILIGVRTTGSATCRLLPPGCCCGRFRWS
jgi:hypothetical protein